MKALRHAGKPGKPTRRSANFSTNGKDAEDGGEPLFAGEALAAALFFLEMAALLAGLLP